MVRGGSPRRVRPWALISKHRLSTAAAKYVANPLVKTLHRVGLPFPRPRLLAPPRPTSGPPPAATGGAARVLRPPLLGGLPCPATAIIETTGGKSGQPRRNPVGKGLDGD